MSNLLLPQPHKMYKLFLVEVDDDERERVLSGLARAIEITHDVDYSNMKVDDMVVQTFPSYVETTLTMKLGYRPDGTLFTIENFGVEDEELSDEDE